MADTKITGLSALTTPAVGDLLVTVDVSDTTMDAAGTDKKITLASLSGYRYVASGRFKFDAQAAFTTVLHESGSGVPGGSQGSFGIFYINPTDYPSHALMRVKTVVVTNDTAPTSTFTCGLYPVANSSGAAATVSFTVGTVVSGSTAAIVAPAASNDGGVAVSTDFAVPTAGFYCLQLVITTNMAASSSAMVRATLDVKH